MIAICLDDLVWSSKGYVVPSITDWIWAIPNIHDLLLFLKSKKILLWKCKISSILADKISSLIVPNGKVITNYPDQCEWLNLSNFINDTIIPKYDIYIIVGAPCSGKTYYAERIEGRIISNRRILSMRRGNKEELKNLTEEIKSKESLIFDSCHPTKEDRDFYDDMIKGLSKIILWIARPSHILNDKLEQKIPIMAFQLYYQKFQMPDNCLRLV